MWADDELVVPEELEARTDALFARLDEELGPFPIVLGEDDPAVEYGLDEWPDDDRETLTAALVESGIAHRWDGTTIFVAADAEPTVDELLDGIEAGTVVAGAAAAPPEDALPRLFAAADRLAKDPDDRVGREDVAVLAAACDPGHPPYGLAKNVWRGVVEASGRLAERDRRRRARPVGRDRRGPAPPLARPPVRLTSAPPAARVGPMLLAELEVWHTRPLAPTRRVALGHLVLPADPPPGLRRLAARRRRRRPHRRRRRGPRPRRPPADRARSRWASGSSSRACATASRSTATGSAGRSTSSMARGTSCSFEFDSRGSPLSMLLGAIYAVERLAPESRRVIAPLLHQAMRWRGPIGPALITHLAGTTAVPLSALADPRAWAMDVLGFPVGSPTPTRTSADGAVPPADALGAPRSRRRHRPTRRRRCTIWRRLARSCPSRCDDVPLGHAAAVSRRGQWPRSADAGRRRPRGQLRCPAGQRYAPTSPTARPGDAARTSRRC